MLTASTLPAQPGAAEHEALRELALLADDAADPGELELERLVGDGDFVQPVGDLARHAGPFQRHPGREIAFLHPGQEAQEDTCIERVGEGHR